jgi:hsp70-interacting protein
MESLLRWSVENSVPASSSSGTSTSVTAAGGGQITDSSSLGSAVSGPVAPRQDLDPEIIDLILGKSDAVLMKEALSAAVDRSRSEDERVEALDNFEMLVEQIDNANNIAALRMWEPLQELLNASDSTTSIITQVLWIIGTALQNNPKAQLAYLSISPSPLPTVVRFVTSSDSRAIRSKALYALSGLLKHNSKAVEELDDEMWDGLGAAVTDSEITVRRKMVFLLNALLIPTEVISTEGVSSDSRVGQVPHANSHESHLASPDSVNTSKRTVEALESRGIIKKIVQALVDPVLFGQDGEHSEEDAEFMERVLRLLHTYTVSCARNLPAEENKKVLEYLSRQKTSNLGLAEEELKELSSSLSR